MSQLSEALASRAVGRATASRQADYVERINSIMEATFGLIERSGGVDPSLRDILRETGLSNQAFYKYFESKDELLLLVLEEARRRLHGSLERRMGRASTGEDKVRAWIRGVLGQAALSGTASRTRPFVLNRDRLIEAFPDEVTASVEQLIEQLAGAIAEVPRSEPARRGETRRDAEAIHHAAFGALHAHLVRRTRPAAAEVDHLTRFSLRAIGCESQL